MPATRQRAGRLDDGTRVLEDVLDAGADLVGVDQHDLVDVLAAQPESFLPDAAHRDAVGESPDSLERHAVRRAQRIVHGRGIHRLDADDPDRGFRYFTYDGDAGDESAAADRHEDGVDLAARLTQDLHGRWCPARRSRPDRRRDARTRALRFAHDAPAHVRRRSS